MIRTLCAATSLALLATSARAQQGDSSLQWIRANAIPLTTTEAGHGFADLQPLKRLIGSARIVSLGEATHGTREFFQMKHRMLEFLATEMGFSIFSIEANMPEAYRLNDYVLNGTGDPAELLKGMYFWTWNTEEVLDMIKWMRAFNASGKGRVQFTGFDMQTHTVALDIAQQFVRRYDNAYLATFTDNARGIPATSVTPSAPAFGLVVADFPLERARGRKIRFSGYIKSEGITTGYAGLWWRVDGPGGKMLAFDNMGSRGVTGTTEWKQFTIELPVDSAAIGINFGAILPGNGSAWFDDMSVEVDGQPFSDGRFDFAFESPTLRGFFPNGSGYSVTLDSTVSHSGRRSLRMTRVTPMTTNPNVPVADPARGLASWNDVVKHLEGQRGAYRAAGATDTEIDWAIQNARVVQQAAAMRVGVVSRDRSMALNVKWILDQNPNAKIVLWAHNGHVSRGPMSYRSMGQDLHDMYGSQMVVFGFGFNRGSFQAVSANGGGLQNFTVQPAPGSFDAIMGAAGLPLFALDLRKAPAALRAPLQSRQIGAVFANEKDENYRTRVPVPSLFDILLFVENTTAARPVRR